MPPKKADKAAKPSKDKPAKAKKEGSGKAKKKVSCFQRAVA
jgi:hypothetical protein